MLPLVMHRGDHLLQHMNECCSRHIHRRDHGTELHTLDVTLSGASPQEQTLATETQSGASLHPHFHRIPSHPNRPSTGQGTRSSQRPLTMDPRPRTRFACGPDEARARRCQQTRACYAPNPKLFWPACSTAAPAARYGYSARPTLHLLDTLCSCPTRCGHHSHSTHSWSTTSLRSSQNKAARLHPRGRMV